MPNPDTGSAYVYSSFNSNPAINSLIYGTQWASNSISYSFPPGAGSSYWSTDATGGYGPSDVTTSEPWSPYYSDLSSSDISAVRAALTSWSNVANLHFNEVADNSNIVGDLRFAYTNTPDAQAWAYSPSGTAKGGDVWFDRYGSSGYNEWTPGSYEYQTAIHEIGHTLGLKHPFDTSSFNSQTIPPDLDARMYTVMSYSAYPGRTDIQFSYEPTTPMVLDIAAIQSLYGANTTYNSGNTTYVFSESSSYNEAIWDAGGVDTFIYDSSKGGNINLTAGVGGGSMMGQPIYYQNYYGSSPYYDSIYIANGVVIENATGGSGNDSITGNSSNNVLIGGLGNDTLNGGAGSDTVSYAGAPKGVTVNIGLTSAQNTVGAGVDTLYSFENLTGSSYNDILMGNSGNNVLNGGWGSDTVSYAGATKGVTVNIGLTSAQNTVGAGVDTLYSFENLTGSSYNDVLAGNSGNNILNGGWGSDTISYAGATAGVVVNIGLTSAQNTVGAGVDTLYSFENLTGSSSNDTLTGSAANNTLIGGLGNDKIFGGIGNDVLAGGAGNDTLTGGAGADYFCFNAALTALNKDVITDFNVIDDRIQLENSIMTKLGSATGTLASADFFAGTAAHDANDFIVYNQSTGALYYDMDGTGANAAVQIATIGTTSHASLTSADFMVV